MEILSHDCIISEITLKECEVIRRSSGRPDVELVSAASRNLLNGSGYIISAWLYSIRGVICVLNIHRISNIQRQSNLTDVVYSFYPLC